MMFTTARALVLATVALSVASASNVIERDLLAPGLQSRRLNARELCSGSCADCFGAGYEICPGAFITCYKPGDSRYGIDSCPNFSSTRSSAGATATRSSAASSATSAASSASPSGLGTTGGGTNNVMYCGSRGDTCDACFGSSYVSCPGDSSRCYDPNDLSTACEASGLVPGGSSSSSREGGSMTTSAPSSSSSSSPSESESSSSSADDSASTTTSAAESNETGDTAEGNGGNAAARPDARGSLATVVVGMVAVGFAYLAFL